MSAFVCDSDHFKVLAIFAASQTSGYGNGHLRVDPAYIAGLPAGLNRATPLTDLASAYAEVLYQENLRSVMARYPSDRRDNLPGPINRPEHITVLANDRTLAAYRLSPIAILKMCDCLEYQSCETEDYRQTVAFKLLDAIRGAAIHALPGYDDAPWDYMVKTKAS